MWLNKNDVDCQNSQHFKINGVFMLKFLKRLFCFHEYVFIQQLTEYMHDCKNGWHRDLGIKTICKYECHKCGAREEKINVNI